MGTDELTDFMMAKSVLPKSFSREEISALAGLLQIEEYPAGEILIREGTPACSLMLLISGEVRRMLGDVELNLLHAGEFLGKSMFTDESARGRGVASGLLAHLIETARTAGFERLYLEAGRSDDYAAPARAGPDRCLVC